MSGEYVLVIEDEEDIQELLHYNLSREGYQVACLGSGEEGLKEAASRQPDAIVLDLMLPGLNGLEVCRMLKAAVRTAEIPVIILTAKGEEQDVIAGFDAGADDYVTKPFSPRVLVARLNAVLRRTASVSGDGVLRFQEITLHPGRHEVQVAESPVELTRTEFRLLQLLISRPGWVFSRQQIVNAVHGEDYPVTGRAVDVQVVSLRKKLGAAGSHIVTVRGVGYKMGE